MGIRVFDGVDGPEIDPAMVDWSVTPPDRYFFRQEPGAHNALATVKSKDKIKVITVRATGFDAAAATGGRASFIGLPWIHRAG